MEESKRQRQIGNVIQQEMNDIFQREGLNMIQQWHDFYFKSEGYSRFDGSPNLFEFFPDS
jgi:hypothetical protein